MGQKGATKRRIPLTKPCHSFPLFCRARERRTQDGTDEENQIGTVGRAIALAAQEHTTMLSTASKSSFDALILVGWLDSHPAGRHRKDSSALLTVQVCRS